MLRLALAALLVLALPVASAQATLASLEEPHRAGPEDVLGKIWNITVLPEESEQRALIFRNSPTSGFRVEVYDSAGAVVYNKTLGRGVQTLPALEPGEYRFRAQSLGAPELSFQVTEKVFERTVHGNVSTQLNGTDAYILSSQRSFNVTFTGDVEVEWMSLGAPTADTLPPGEAREAIARGAYVFTIRGAEGTPYGITLDEIETPAREAPPSETPLAAWGALAGLAAAAAMARSRKP